MHSPETLAHEIKYPWYEHKPWPKKDRLDPDPWRLKRRWEEMPEELKATRSQNWPEGYRNSFISIWHVDPERDGSDNSCGYSYVKLTPKQREILRNAAWSEGKDRHYLKYLAKEYPGSVEEAELLYRGMVLLVARVLRLNISLEYATRYSAEAIHIRTFGKFGGEFCFLPGYHTNNAKDSEDDRHEHFHGILCGIARGILTDLRPWYKHPKWHFWHWKFQCHPLQDFKRWAFSRCCKCAGRFTWGYAPVTNNWNAEGPRWFRSEPDVYHSDCNRPSDPCIASTQSPAV